MMGRQSIHNISSSFPNRLALPGALRIAEHTCVSGTRWHVEQRRIGCSSAGHERLTNGKFSRACGVPQKEKDCGPLRFWETGDTSRARLQECRV